jgi:orotate phosphoribosyltransferase
MWAIRRLTRSHPWSSPRDATRDAEGLHGMSQLAAEIHALCQLRGAFVLRSGRQTDSYFDKYRFEAVPNLLAAVAREMVPLIPPNAEVLAGLELGGIPVVTMVSHYSGLPAAFVRKTTKQYGTARLSEGAEISGKQVVIVEDIITTGGQVCLSAAELRQRGAKISHALSVIDRGEGGAAKLAEDGIVLRALFDRADFNLL